MFVQKGKRRKWKYLSTLEKLLHRITPEVQRAVQCACSVKSETAYRIELLAGQTLRAVRLVETVPALLAVFVDDTLLRDTRKPFTTFVQEGTHEICGFESTSLINSRVVLHQRVKTTFTGCEAVI